MNSEQEIRAKLGDFAADQDLMRDVYMTDSQRAAYQRILSRALEQREGFVMVPVEPTPEMLRPFAAMAILAQGHDPDEPQPPHGEYPRWYGACSPIATAYAAMLAAAPKESE